MASRSVKKPSAIATLVPMKPTLVTPCSPAGLGDHVGEVEQRDADRGLDLVGDLVERRRAQQQEVGAARARRPGPASASSSPICSQRSSSSSCGQLGEVDGAQHQPWRGQPAEPLLHAEVQVAVVDRAALPAHPADQSDGLHGAQSSSTPRSRASRGWHRAGAPRRSDPVDLVLGGLGARPDHQLVDVDVRRAGWRSTRRRRRRPRRPAGRGRRRTPPRPCLVPAEAHQRRTPRCAPCPGAISQTRIGSPHSSSRSVSVTTWVPCLAAV